MAPEVYGHIVKGYRDIFPYVQLYWARHLLACLELENRAEAQPQVMSKLIDLLLQFSQRLSQRASSHGNLHENMPICLQGHADSITIPLLRLPTVIQKYLIFRNDVKNKDMPSTISSNDRENTISDPTILTEAFSSFRNAFENLLRGSNELQCQEIGIAPADLYSFRSRHNNAPYLCRHSGCARTTFGFDTVDERKQHESTHTPKFLCVETNCEERFTTRRALLIHTRKYHAGIEDIILPPFPALEEPAGPKRLKDITQEGTDSLIRPGSDRFLSLKEVTLLDPSVERHIFDQLNFQGPLAGWLASIPIRERAGYIALIAKSLHLHRPPVNLPRAVEVALQFERKSLSQVPAKQILFESSRKSSAGSATHVPKKRFRAT